MFGWLSSFVRDFLAPLVKALADKRIRQLAEYARTACANLELSDLSGFARREIVFAALRAEAQQLGLEIKEHVLNAILEAALARVRDK
jgi:hypothetical protein